MYDTTFETLAGTEKLVAWFHAQGFQIDASAPRVDNDWAVPIFSTEEGLRRYPVEDDAPYPRERTLQLAAVIIDDVEACGTGFWWEGWPHPTDEETAEIDHP
jgi:hypothetical protein